MIKKNIDKAVFIENAIELNEKMSKSYFWTPPGGASPRRWYEKHNSLEGTFTLKGNLYEVSLITDCSCKNIYFRRSIKVNGEKKTITALKKALKLL